MENLWQRIVENLFGRLDGPLHFRFVVQPLMAVIYAVLDGIRDAKQSKPAYFRALLANPGNRKELLKDGWKHAGKVFLLGVALDIIYQVKVFHRFYPIEMLIVALTLAVVPYLLLRGPINRIISTRRISKQ